MRLPKYRRHSSGQAVVRLRDAHTGIAKDFYLGVHGTGESQRKYTALLAEWQANDGRLPGPAAQPEPVCDTPTEITVDALCTRYEDHADGYYAGGEARSVKAALRIARDLYGATPACEFGPACLRACREKMIDHGWRRTSINLHVGRIVRMFKWGVSHELVPTATWQALTSVDGLRAGRTRAPESESVEPVDFAVVEQTIPHLSPPLQIIARLQMLTGARAGELVIMRPMDIDRNGPHGVWLYRPHSHKNTHRGKSRVIPLGEHAQTLIAPYLDRPHDLAMFSPRESERARTGAKHPNLNTQYSVTAYGRAVARACKKHGIPHWHPHQIRHTVATNLEREHGLETARLMLGHSSALVTAAVYVERDIERIAMVAANV